MDFPAVQWRSIAMNPPAFKHDRQLPEHAPGRRKPR